MNAGGDWVEGVLGVLVDVDGTLLDGPRAIPGAAEFVVALKTAALPFRVTSNNTRRPRRAVAAALGAAGIEVDPESVLIPAHLARARIVGSGRTRAMLIVPEASKEDFHGVVEDGASPDWVVVGDVGRAFGFDLLNRAFAALRGGARLIALHKNPFWRSEAGTTVLDAGPFVAALEYAAGIEAEVIGKPSREFWSLALGDLGLAPEHVLAVGDSVENDAIGPHALGCRTAIVRGAAFREERLVELAFVPDLVVDSVAGLRPQAP